MTKEKQYRYKYEYQFKYQYEYEHKHGNQDSEPDFITKQGTCLGMSTSPSARTDCVISKFSVATNFWTLGLS